MEADVGLVGGVGEEVERVGLGDPHDLGGEDVRSVVGGGGQAEEEAACGGGDAEAEVAEAEELVGEEGLVGLEGGAGADGRGGVGVAVGL